jgi:hypothetical protein
MRCFADGCGATNHKHSSHCCVGISATESVYRSLPWKRCRAARVTSSQPVAQEPYSNALAWRHRVCAEILFTGLCLETSCATQQWVDMSQYYELTEQFAVCFVKIPWRLRHPMPLKRLCTYQNTRRHFLSRVIAILTNLRPKISNISSFVDQQVLRSVTSQY